MSAFELLIDCVKDATKERDELADALELKDETIQAMESVLAKIGTRLKVPAGDVPALLEAIDQLTAGISEPETDFRKARGVLSVPDQGNDDG